MIMKKFKMNKYIFKRLIAYIIDWYLASLVCMLPFLVIGLANQIDYRYIMNLKLYTTQDLMIGLFISLLFSFIYFFVIPLKLFPGQTIGKKIMNLKIITSSNQEMSVQTLFLRQILFIWLIEISLHSIGGILNQVIFIIIQSHIIILVKDLSIFTIIISIFMFLVTSHYVTLHDFISKTKVIDLKSY